MNLSDDDVAVEIGILHAAERVEDRRFGNSCHCPYSVSTSSRCSAMSPANGSL